MENLQTLNNLFATWIFNSKESEIYEIFYYFANLEAGIHIYRLIPFVIIMNIFFF